MSDKELTEEVLDTIAARAEGAQPGPWKSFIEGRDHESGSSFIRVGIGKSRSQDIELSGATDADQDFIAHARQDVPRLVAEIKRLRELLIHKVRADSTGSYRSPEGRPTGPLREMEASLTGRTLTSVEFVLDYHQLRFDDATLTAIVNPKVERDEKVLSVECPGFRDALCNLIGNAVVDVKVDEGVSLSVHLSDESRVSISLEDEDYVHGPEAVTVRLGTSLWVL